jgi:hypothetical protein
MRVSRVVWAAGSRATTALVRLCARAAVVSAVTATTLVLVAVPALADDVTVTPSANGMGTLGPKIQHLLDMTAQVALWASLGSILAGAAVWGLSKHFSSYGAANKGMQLAIGGGVGGLLTASAASIVNFMFKA